MRFGRVCNDEKSAISVRRVAAPGIVRPIRQNEQGRSSKNTDGIPSNNKKPAPSLNRASSHQETTPGDGPPIITAIGRADINRVHRFRPVLLDEPNGTNKPSPPGKKRLRRAEDRKRAPVKLKGSLGQPGQPR